MESANILNIKVSETGIQQQQQQPLYNWNDITHGNDLWSVYAPADCVVTKIPVKEGQEVKKGEILMYLEFEAMEIKEDDTMVISPSSTQSDSKDDTATYQVFSQPPRISESAKSKVGPYLALPTDIESILAIPLSDKIWTEGFRDVNFEDQVNTELLYLMKLHHYFCTSLSANDPAHL